MSLITFYTTPFVSISPAPPLIRSLAFSSNGSQIAVGYDNGYIEIYPTPYVDLNSFDFTLLVVPLDQSHQRNDELNLNKKSTIERMVYNH